MWVQYMKVCKHTIYVRVLVCSYFGCGRVHMCACCHDTAYMIVAGKHVYLLDWQSVRWEGAGEDDGWGREGWILTDQWKDWQLDNNGSIQTFLFFLVANFPGTPIFTLLRYDDCSWILEMIYCLLCRILMCLYLRVIYWKLFPSFCRIGRARAKCFLIHENYMKPNHV